MPHGDFDDDDGKWQKPEGPSSMQGMPECTLETRCELDPNAERKPNKEK